MFPIISEAIRAKERLLKLRHRLKTESKMALNKRSAESKSN